MIGFYILLFCAISIVLGLIGFVFLVRSERERVGFIYLGEFLAVLLVCLIPVVNLYLVYLILEDTNLLNTQLFVVKK